MTPREAAKRLCMELDRLGLKPLPHRHGKIVITKGKQSQTVMLRPTNDEGNGAFHWFWVWDGFRTDGGVEADRGPKMGEEADFARRICNVMDVPQMDQVRM